MRQERSEIQRLVTEHVAFAMRLARRFFREKRNAGIDLDDLVGAAMLGLCEAASRFDPEKGENFRTFCFIRIRGAMYDCIRRGAGSPRGTIGELHVYRSFRAGAGIAEGGNGDGEQAFVGFDNLSADACIDEFDMRLHASHDAEHADISYARSFNPELSLLRKSTRKYLGELLGALPERERSILQSRYYEERSFDEMSDELGGVSKSWISRLHVRALGTLRDRIIADASICQMRLGAYHA